MSLRGIRHGAIVRCDAKECGVEFVSYSHKHLVRAQTIAAGWARVPRWLLEPEIGKGKQRSDVCPSHRVLASERADRVTSIERALGSPLTSRALMPGMFGDPRIERARQRVAKRLAGKGKQAALEAYLELVKWSPTEQVTRDRIAAANQLPNQPGDIDADRACAEQPQENDRQGEADQERDQGRRRSPRRDRADRDERGGSERGSDANAAARAPRPDADAGDQAPRDAGAAGAGPQDPVVVEIPRRMPRARRNGDGPSVLDVIAEIMARQIAPRTMNAHEIVAAATGDLALPTNSKTPHTIVSRDLALDVKNNGATSRFVRTAPGRFALRDHLGRLGVAFNDQSAEIKDSFSVEKTHPEGADHG